MLTSSTALTHQETGSITSPKGFKAAGIHAGFKYKRNDLGVIYSETPATSAAVYTLNHFPAAPIKVTKESISEEGLLQAVVVNSAFANACTGKRGEDDAYEMRGLAASHLRIPDHYVAVASTGVIGELIPMEKMRAGMAQLQPESGDHSAASFNQAILTTDLKVKSACWTMEIDGKTVTIGGSAKGSGMINPNMATMLSFITTDANIALPALNQALKEVTDKTFNRITVDGETSTNDMVLVMANGQAENDELTTDHEEWDIFVEGLRRVSEDLSKMVARDGEGATKLIEVEVDGAATENEAGVIAKRIVGSDLVKTAVYGADANWGRIIQAIGQSSATIDPEKVDVWIGPIQMLKESRPLHFSEEQASAYLKEEQVTIKVDLHVGNACAKAWGCDLTYDYIKINASYRT
ncbi:bifunctional ornithine acetyltransferase/N-acetylglutamate synthase [Bacillaceae bacterium SIJ1]|uniref:bifunctional ornithine acetyltransferase/N-acetylglutamate synthase n=1 Tax=Litoribacterium kuwaitense TaxID=1398745 RepID=UPI0013EDC9CC|nr:bifunctional ornithine acetyltransferase/N-acetylglutamate synthase [Litoribacterium kuwaitense]NGP44549.1 bifunctional ornithine acetyltransferase/N-acetylglutamate synthase [Litoribacterium kuwaitense]